MSILLVSIEGMDTEILKIMGKIYCGIKKLTNAEDLSKLSLGNLETLNLLKRVYHV